jgi:hypothetical protein
MEPSMSLNVVLTKEEFEEFGRSGRLYADKQSRIALWEDVYNKFGQIPNIQFLNLFVEKDDLMEQINNSSMYANYVYDIVRLDCEGMDSIYKDYIKQMVGVYGLNALIEHKLVESCGVVNGRQLYVLCDKEK